MASNRVLWSAVLVGLLAGVPGCDDTNPGLVVAVRPDPAGVYEAVRLFGRALPATFTEEDEYAWVYRAGELEIVKDGRYELEIDALLVYPDTAYTGVLVGDGFWLRSPLSDLVLDLDVPDVDFIVDGDTILTGTFQMQTILSIEQDALVSLGGAPDDIWSKR